MSAESRLILPHQVASAPGSLPMSWKPIAVRGWKKVSCPNRPRTYALCSLAHPSTYVDRMQIWYAGVMIDLPVEREREKTELSRNNGFHAENLKIKSEHPGNRRNLSETVAVTPFRSSGRGPMWGKTIPPRIDPSSGKGKKKNINNTRHTQSPRFGGIEEARRT